MIPDITKIRAFEFEFYLHFNNAEEHYETLNLWFWNLQEK